MANYGLPANVDGSGLQQFNMKESGEKGKWAKDGGQWVGEQR